MYADQQAMVDRFGEREITQLTDRDGTAGAIVSAVLDQALQDADAEIDGYLRGHYPLPLSPVPTVLIRLAADIARYRLYDDQVPETVAKRYDAAVRFLRDLARGRIRLGADASREAGAGAPDHVSASPVFGDLDGYR